MYYRAVTLPDNGTVARTNYGTDTDDETLVCMNHWFFNFENIIVISDKAEMQNNNYVQQIQ